MHGRLDAVAMRRPGAILTADPDRWHYGRALDATALVKQFDAFAHLLAEHGVDIVWIDSGGDDGDGLADSIFTYDPSFVVGDAAVILRPGKTLRMPEADLHRRFYEQHHVSILGQIHAPGTIEGGDCFWLDDSTIVVGRGFRTNQAGIDQFIDLVEPTGVAVEVYDLPYLHGPDACLHLLSVVSPLADDLALVYAPLMPTALYQRMTDAGYELLHAPADEFEASRGLSLNVLATRPRCCIAVAGFPKTAALMRAAGCEVSLIDADELCLPCEGGPTCLTRPLLRADG